MPLRWTRTGAAHPQDFVSWLPAVTGTLIPARCHSESTPGGLSVSSQFSLVYAALNYFDSTVISARACKEINES